MSLYLLASKQIRQKLIRKYIYIVEVNEINIIMQIMKCTVYMYMQAIPLHSSVASQATLTAIDYIHKPPQKTNVSSRIFCHIK